VAPWSRSFFARIPLLRKSVLQPGTTGAYKMLRLICEQALSFPADAVPAASGVQTFPRQRTQKWQMPAVALPVRRSVPGFGPFQPSRLLHFDLKR